MGFGGGEEVGWRSQDRRLACLKLVGAVVSMAWRILFLCYHLSCCGCGGESDSGIQCTLKLFLSALPSKPPFLLEC